MSSLTAGRVSFPLKWTILVLITGRESGESGWLEAVSSESLFSASKSTHEDQFLLQLGLLVECKRNVKVLSG